MPNILKESIKQNRNFQAGRGGGGFETKKTLCGMDIYIFWNKPISLGWLGWQWLSFSCFNAWPVKPFLTLPLTMLPCFKRYE